MTHTNVPLFNAPLDKLLTLIANGDAEDILALENSGENINALMKYELIIIEEGKISLTPLGEKALKTGVASIIQQDDMTPPAETGTVSKLPETRIKNTTKFIVISLLILLTILVMMALQMAL